MDRMRETVAGVRPDAIIHLAARAGVRPSIEQPQLYEQVNVAGTVNLLELCREFQVSRLIFGSSSSVYGASSRAPFSEEQSDLRPISPYAATKLAGELFCYTYAHLYKLPVMALRFFTVYGPRQRPDLAIHKFVARIEAGKPIPIFGDGETGRDYTYVDDIVAGVLGALDYDFSSTDGAPFEICNLGNSHPDKTFGTGSHAGTRDRKESDCPAGSAATGRRATDVGRHFKSREAARLPPANYAGGRSQEICRVVSRRRSEPARVMLKDSETGPLSDAGRRNLSIMVLHVTKLSQHACPDRRSVV